MMNAHGLTSLNTSPSPWLKDGGRADHGVPRGFRGSQLGENSTMDTVAASSWYANLPKPPNVFSHLTPPQLIGGNDVTTSRTDLNGSSWGDSPTDKSGLYIDLNRRFLSGVDDRSTPTNEEPFRKQYNSKAPATVCRSSMTAPQLHDVVSLIQLFAEQQQPLSSLPQQMDMNQTNQQRSSLDHPELQSWQHHEPLQEPGFACSSDATRTPDRVISQVMQILERLASDNTSLKDTNRNLLAQVFELDGRLAVVEAGYRRLLAAAGLSAAGSRTRLQGTQANQLFHVPSTISANENRAPNDAGSVPPDAFSPTTPLTSGSVSDEQLPEWITDSSPWPGAKDTTGGLTLPTLSGDRSRHPKQSLQDGILVPPLGDNRTRGLMSNLGVPPGMVARDAQDGHKILSSDTQQAQIVTKLPSKDFCPSSRADVSGNLTNGNPRIFPLAETLSATKSAAQVVKAKQAKAFLGVPSFEKPQFGDNRLSLGHHSEFVWKVPLGNPSESREWESAFSVENAVKNFCMWKISNITKMNQVDCIVSPPFALKCGFGELRLRLQPVKMSYNMEHRQRRSNSYSEAAGDNNSVGQDISSNEETCCWRETAFSVHVSIACKDCLIKYSLIAGSRISEPRWHRFGCLGSPRLTGKSSCKGEGRDMSIGGTSCSYDPSMQSEGLDTSDSSPSAKSTLQGVVDSTPWAGINQFVNFNDCVDFAKNSISIGVAIFEFRCVGGNPYGASHGGRRGNKISGFSPVLTPADKTSTTRVRALYDELNRALNHPNQSAREIATCEKENGETRIPVTAQGQQTIKVSKETATVA